MFGRHGEGENEVHGADFFVGGLVVGGDDADPYETGEVADVGEEGSPDSTAFPVAVVGGVGAEDEEEGHYDTKDCD